MKSIVFNCLSASSIDHAAITNFNGNEIDEFVEEYLTQSEDDYVENYLQLLLSEFFKLKEGRSEKCDIFALSILKYLYYHHCCEKACEHGIAALNLLIEEGGQPEIQSLYIELLSLITETYPKVLAIFDLLPNFLSYLKGESDWFALLINKKWNGNNAGSIAQSLSYASLNKKQLSTLLSKLLSILPDQEACQLPNMVYQIVLVSSKCNPEKGIEGLVEFFMEFYHKLMEDEQGSSLKSLQLIGTVLQQFFYSAIQNPSVYEEFIKVAKTYGLESIFTFSCPLLLTISSISQFKDQVEDILCCNIIHCFTSQIRMKNSALIRTYTESGYNIQSYMMQIVENCCFKGWDSVTEGLINLSFSILRHVTSRAFRGFVSKRSESKSLQGLHGKNQLSKELIGLNSSTDRACQLCMEIIITMFQHLKGIRSDIIRTIIKEIITNSSNPNVQIYLELLSSLIMKSPNEFSSDLSQIRYLTDYLLQFPCSVAVALVHALVPLVQTSVPFRNQFVMALRKAVFARSLEIQKMAVASLILILKHFQIANEPNQSQPNCSFQGGLFLSQFSQMSSQYLECFDNSSVNESLCSEIMNLVQRSMVQSNEIKKVLYRGLYDVLICNQALAGRILNLMQHQFNNYFERDVQTIPPVKLINMVHITEDNQCKIEEPLESLMYFYQKSIRHCESHYLNQSILDELDSCTSDIHTFLPSIKEDFDSLCLRMSEATLIDFDLSNDSDFCGNTPIGRRNQILSRSLYFLYDACMEYEVHDQKPEQQDKLSELVTILFQRQESLRRLIKKKVTKDSRQKGVFDITFLSDCQMDLSSCVKFLKLCFGQLDESSSSELTNVTAVVELVEHILQHSINKVNNLATQERITRRNKKQIITNISELIKLCVTFYHSRIMLLSDDSQNNNQELDKTTRSLMHSILTLLVALFKTSFVCFSEHINDLLSGIDWGKLKKSTSRGRLSGMAMLLKTWISNLMEPATQEKSFQRQLALLFPLIISICKERVTADSVEKISSDSLLQVFNWLVAFLKSWPLQLDDSNLVRSVITQVLDLSRNLSGDEPGELLVTLSADLLLKLKEVSDNTGETTSSDVTLEIVTESNSYCVLSCLLTGLDHIMDDLEWLFKKINTYHTRNEEIEKSSTESGVRKTSFVLNDKINQMKNDLCHRLNVVARTVDQLIQCAVSPRAQAESLMKAFTRLYALFSSLTKYFIDSFKQNKGFPKSFERLVKFSGIKMSPHCYAFISFVQTSDADLLTRELMEKKSKKAKKKTEEKPSKKNSLFKSFISRSMKDSKIISNLIYTIEQYERYLILLSKKSKIQLLAKFKSLSRDFRIDQNVLQEVLQSDEEDASAESENEEELENVDLQENDMESRASDDGGSSSEVF